MTPALRAVASCSETHEPGENLMSYRKYLIMSWLVGCDRIKLTWAGECFSAT